VDPRALAGERWLAFPSRPGAPREPYASVFQGRLAASGLGAAEIVLVDSLTAQKRMVEAGFGLALLPESSVDEELRAGSLRALPVRALRATLPIALIHRRRAFLSGATQALRTRLAAWGAE
jgi:DNA-binding transcriptional LysR family regulator